MWQAGKCHSQKFIFIKIEIFGVFKVPYLVGGGISGLSYYMKTGIRQLRTVF